MEIHILIYSLIVTALTGITVIAYRHPAGYIKIFYWLLIPVLTILSYLLSSSASGIHYHIRSLKNSLAKYPDNKIETFEHGISNMNEDLDMLLLSLAIGLFIIGYLYFLYKLPTILETNKDDENNI